MITTMKPKTGRMAVVVPNGVLFRGGSEGKIRQKLIEENLLDAVIGLPDKLFYGTGIPAAILIFSNGKTEKNVLFIDSSRNFNSGKNQNILGEEHINSILTTYRHRINSDRYSYRATIEEIRENEFNLNISRYVDTFEIEREIDLVAVHTEREALKLKLSELEVKMTAYLKELNYVD